MNAATAEIYLPREDSAMEGTPIEKLLEQWLLLWHDYRTRERRELIEKNPTPQTLADYRNELRWLLRSGRAMQALVADPDYPAPQQALEISGKLLQLQGSWEMLNNPLSDEDALALIRKNFPDESRVGSPA